MADNDNNSSSNVSSSIDGKQLVVTLPYRANNSAEVDADAESVAATLQAMNSPRATVATSDNVATLTAKDRDTDQSEGEIDDKMEVSKSIASLLLPSRLVSKNTSHPLPVSVNNRPLDAASTTEHDAAGKMLPTNNDNTTETDADQYNMATNDPASNSGEGDTSGADADGDRGDNESLGMEAENEDDTAENAKESEAYIEASYSTRGRTTVDELSDRLSDPAPTQGAAKDNANSANAAGSNILLPHHHIEKTQPQVHASFLSDSLTEEERRTRTRYIPAVEGMRGLNKNEIKSDLSLCRAILQQQQRRATNKRNADSMEVDEYDTSAGGGAGMATEDGDVKAARLVDIYDQAVPIPSSSFVPTIQDEAIDGGITHGSNTTLPSPRIIGNVTAFSPPRPPESVGAKKKHRLLRWERRPSDIEVDLHNYHRTVQRTREELRNAESELSRVLRSEAHWRRHFMTHIHNLNLEWSEIHEELSSVEEECISIADLLTNRRRSRGVSAWSYIMKAFLPMMRSPDEDFEMKRLTMLKEGSKVAVPRGIGGVGAMSFVDWDRDTNVPTCKIASSWLMPGDKVETPYGKGTVMSVFAPCSLEDMEAAVNDILTLGSKSSMDIDTPNADDGTKARRKDRANVVEDKQVGSRAAVKLPYGIGFFNLACLTCYEDPTWYSDSRLALRWKGISETALAVAGALDIQAMSSNSSSGISKKEQNSVVGSTTTETKPMNIDGMSTRDDKLGDDSDDTDRPMVPFGSNMIPTRNGRGFGLIDAPLPVIENDYNTKLCDSEGVLGLSTNTGVLTSVFEKQALEQKHLDLQAEVLQLRNELYRARRVRVLNERTVSATVEKTSKMETLVSEMRADLQSLRNRLSEEVREMGISEEQEAEMLSEYYRSLVSKDLVANSNKRARTDSDESATDYRDDEEMMDAAAVEEGEVLDTAAEATETVGV